MSTQLSTPIESMFDLHRTFVRQNQALVHDAVEAQQSAFEASRQSLDAWRSMTRQNAEFVRSLSEASITNVASASPQEIEGMDEAGAFVAEQVAMLEEASEETFDLSEEALDEASGAYAEFVEAYLEGVDAAVDAYLEATDEFEATADSVADSIDIDEN